MVTTTGNGCTGIESLGTQQPGCLGACLTSKVAPTRPVVFAEQPSRCSRCRRASNFDENELILFLCPAEPLLLELAIISFRVPFNKAVVRARKRSRPRYPLLVSGSDARSIAVTGK